MERHLASWWAGFLAESDRFDRAYLVEGFGELLLPQIKAPLLRREVQNAADTVVRYLERPANEERREYAREAIDRLADTLARIEDRSTGSAISTEEAAVVLSALRGDYGEAAAAAEPLIGAAKLQRLFVTALRRERFDIPLTLRLLQGGQTPAEAVRSGNLIGRYSWWPAWLLRIVTERALAGTLDEETIAALDKCAYAELSPIQANLARKLLNGDDRLIRTAAERLAGLGEPDAATRLRDGDLTAVALAARLVSA
ncbi:hypothetical protein Asp14428_77440 [Actinoplanes sp. NBRC 14428]|uniref:Uncharacterized protein n=1 Tax=Pseudosporangium ferrugineum TaxID=439699 RepID=A0A2T0RWW9_9ACTN|nr:hypothetical protein [Pseudosporangium ferrugineum]PRY25686.1 hypothetical protein CLV70_11252 [Pseudosporangium ferrugineum]BCJ56269.1 hypothetical protein Asp14428_77440 [Actinoplanes sp. NBRC 14428]